MRKGARKAIGRHLRKIAKKAIRRMRVRRIVRQGKHVKSLNYAKPRFGSIMLA